MNLITQLGVASAQQLRSIGTVPRSKLDWLSAYEPDAWDHWIFNKAALSLDGLVNGRDLSPASVSPVYADSYLQLDNDNGKQLNTLYPDTAGAVDTIWAVIRRTYTGAGLNMQWGNFLTSSVGGSMFLSTANAQLYYGYGGVVNSPNTGLVLPNRSAFYFVAISRDFSGAVKSIRSMVGSQGQHLYTSGAGLTYNPGSSETVALGNKYYTTGSGTVDDIMEFGIIPKYMSESELDALYARRKAQLAKLGYTVT